MKGSKSSSSRVEPRRTAEVVLDIEVDAGRAHLVLANCGDAAATEVVVEFSRPLAGIDDALPVSELPVFKRLGVLRPGQTLRIFWNSAPALLGSRDGSEPFVATVTWSERARPRQRASYRHDLSIYRRWPACVEPPRPGP
jgi:hypothetical protein